MKIIYSFNTNGGKIFPGKFYKRMAELSVRSAKRCGYPVELYADLWGIEFFKQLNFPFDSYHLIEPEKYGVNFSYWNFGKLLTYSLQNEPFLHVDFDTYFHEGFRIPESGDIITEMLREYTFVRAFRDVAILDTNVLPEKLICSGLVGGYNTNIWKELFSRAEEICMKPIPVPEKAMGYLVGVEEFNLSQIAQFLKLKVVELDHNKFDHWQGENKEKNYGQVINELYNINCK